MSLSITSHAIIISKETASQKKKWIQQLFTQGRRHHHYPLNVRFLLHPHPQANAHQTLIAVPKKNVRKAVHRNKIKRRIREAYRKLQPIIHTLGPKLLIGFTFCGKTLQQAHYQTLEKTVQAALAYIHQHFSKGIEA